MVLHFLPERPVRAAGEPAAGEDARPVAPSGARAGFVVGRTVGNSVVRHRVTRRLRAAVRDELDRLPPTADLVVRARPEAADADFSALRHDLARGLDRLLGQRTRR